MRHYNAKPLRVDLRPSAWLTGILVALAGMALSAVLSLSWPWWCKLLCAIMLLAATGHALLLHARLSFARSLVSLQVDSMGEVSIGYRDGNRYAALVQPDSVVTAWLTLVALQLPGQQCDAM